MLKNDTIHPTRFAASASTHIHSRRLTVADVPALARLERVSYPREMRAGRAQLRRDFKQAELDDSNLGYGLFDGEDLVGVFLVYYEPDCRRIYSYFDLECPPDVAAEECLYVADVSVKREYARYTQRLLKAYWQGISPEFRRLRAYAFSSRSAVEKWRARPRAFNWIGYDYVSDQQFRTSGAPHEIFLVRFDPTARPKHRPPSSAGLRVEEIRTDAGWQSLEPHWDALLRETPDSTCFQSFQVQRVWSRHLMVKSRLFILAVYQGRELRAIAPLRIETVEYYRQERRLLKFIGEPSEMDRPTILRRGDDPDAVRAVFEHVLERRALWDSLLFYEQPKGGALLTAAGEALQCTDLLVGVVDGPPCPWVNVRGSWQQFLASKPRSFRKQLSLKRNRLARVGEVRFVAYDGWPQVAEGFDLYLQTERRSWKPEKRLGVAKDAASLTYHRALVDELGPLGRVRIRVLFVGDKPIAASLGLLGDGVFLSLHIAHDQEFGHFSPGVLLTANELEACYAAADCADYEFLGGFLSNKLTWTANVRETRQLFVYSNSPLFRMHYVWHFKLEAPLKRLLRRARLLDPLLKLKASLRKLGGAKRAPDADPGD
jgi:CelD/BcsL family acetyltransferase involved in cellulose biosynthesis